MYGAFCYSTRTLPVAMSAKFLRKLRDLVRVQVPHGQW